MRRAVHSAGNGDRCPVVPQHGAMFVLSDADRQYCSHHAHDGHGSVGPTPSLWPTGHLSFAAAVALYHGIRPSLPELNVILTG